MELERLVQGSEQIALHSLEHIGDFAARLYDAPPPLVRKYLEEAQRLIRASQHEAARRVFRDAVESEMFRTELGVYREHVTWVEAENARRLATLAWVHHTLMPRAVEGDDVLMRKLVRLEAFAAEHYGASELSMQRGWADMSTRRTDLLPRSWRHA